MAIGTKKKKKKQTNKKKTKFQTSAHEDQSIRRKRKDRCIFVHVSFSFHENTKVQ